MCLLAFCMPSLKKCLLRFFMHFSIGLFGFLLFSCIIFLCILDINPLSDLWFVNVFPVSQVAFSLCWFLSLCRAFQCDVVPLVYFLLCACALSVIFKSITRTYVKGFYSVFLSRSFRVSGCTFRSLIHLELIFVEYFKIWVQFHYFKCEYPGIPTPFIEKIVFFHCVFL